MGFAPPAAGLPAAGFAALAALSFSAYSVSFYFLSKYYNKLPSASFLSKIYFLLVGATSSGKTLEMTPAATVLPPSLSANL